MTQQNTIRRIIWVTMVLPVVAYAQEPVRFGITDWSLDEAVYFPAYGLWYNLFYSWLPVLLFFLWMFIYITAIKAWPEARKIFLGSYKYGWLVLATVSILLVAIPYIIAKIVCPVGYDFFGNEGCGWYVDYASEPLVLPQIYITHVLIFIHWAVGLVFAVTAFRRLNTHKTRPLVFTPLFFFALLILAPLFLEYLRHLINESV